MKIEIITTIIITTNNISNNSNNNSNNNKTTQLKIQEQNTNQNLKFYYTQN